jgi:hypothetical protein
VLTEDRNVSTRRLLLALSTVVLASASTVGLALVTAGGAGAVANGHGSKHAAAAPAAGQRAGTTWSPPTPIPGISGGTTYSTSCASATFCAVGGATVSNGTQVPYVEVDDNGTWKGAFTLSGGIDEQGGLSCPTAGWCMTVSVVYGYWAVYQNGSWQQSTTTIPNWGGVYDLSCSSTTFCVAVGGGIWVYRNGTWSDSSLPGGQSYYGYSVHCFAGDTCIAVDYQGNAYDYDPSSAAWVAAPSFAATGQADGMSCTSTDFCEVADTGSSPTGPRMWTFRAGSWSSQQVPAFMSVSCADDTDCIGVSENGDAFSFDGTTWSQAAASIDTNSIFFGGPLSCPTADFCGLVDAAGNFLDSPYAPATEPVDGMGGLGVLFVGGVGLVAFEIRRRRRNVRSARTSPAGIA